MVGKLNNMLSAAVFIDSLSTKSSSTQSSNATAPVSKSESSQSGQSGQQPSLSTALRFGESTLKSAADSKQTTSLPQQPEETQQQQPLTKAEIVQMVDSLNNFFNKNYINLEVRYEAQDPDSDSDSDSEKTKESKKNPPSEKHYKPLEESMLKMRYDEEAGLINVKIIEKSTQKVLREFPPKEFLDRIKRANEKSQEFLGALIDRLI